MKAFDYMRDRVLYLTEVGTITGSSGVDAVLSASGLGFGSLRPAHAAAALLVEPLNADAGNLPRGLGNMTGGMLVATIDDTDVDFTVSVDVTRRSGAATGFERIIEDAPVNNNANVAGPFFFSRPFGPIKMRGATYGVPLTTDFLGAKFTFTIGAGGASGMVATASLFLWEGATAADPMWGNESSGTLYASE